MLSVNAVAFLLLAVIAGAAGAQELPAHRQVETGSGTVELDGVISDQEYTLRHLTEAVAVYLVRLDEDTIQVAVEAAGEGWVSVGFGSEKMDGSRMLIGFVEDGEARFEEHLGSGWRHSLHEQPVVQGSAVSRSTPPGPDTPVTTMLEARLPAEAVEVNGRGEPFPIIYAVGPRPNFTARHRARGSQMLVLE
ncbi:DOMON domain protein [Spirochaeta africana DSM 8902]|uniref:DOMON domain protein n=2 Tax=Spirochaeta TaxID=146 RepID=H9UGD4_SPIAZ|nr:DOMON domain protein [Spirochaeta africana DSM 8902]